MLCGILVAKLWRLRICSVEKRKKGLWRTLVECCRCCCCCCCDWEKLYCMFASRVNAKQTIIIVKLSCMICCVVWLLVGSLCCVQLQTEVHEFPDAFQMNGKYRTKEKKRMETFWSGVYVSRWTHNKIMAIHSWHMGNQINSLSSKWVFGCMSFVVLFVGSLSLPNWLENNNWNNQSVCGKHRDREVK